MGRSNKIVPRETFLFCSAAVGVVTAIDKRVKQEMRAAASDESIAVESPN